MRLHQEELKEFVFDVRQDAGAPAKHLDPERGHGGQLAQDVPHGHQRILRDLLEAQRLPVFDHNGTLRSKPW